MVSGSSIECLCSKRKALSSNSSNAKKKKGCSKTKQTRNQEKNFDPCLPLYMKINSKWITV
jgi:hypothetical protein